MASPVLVSLFRNYQKEWVNKRVCCCCLDLYTTPKYQSILWAVYNASNTLPCSELSPHFTNLWGLNQPWGSNSGHVPTTLSCKANDWGSFMIPPSVSFSSKSNCGSPWTIWEAERSCLTLAFPAILSLYDSTSNSPQTTFGGWFFWGSGDMVALRAKPQKPVLQGQKTKQS